MRFSRTRFPVGGGDSCHADAGASWKLPATTLCRHWLHNSVVVTQVFVAELIMHASTNLLIDKPRQIKKGY